MFECLNKLFAYPIVSVLAGSVVTWLFSRLYYKKAGDELKAEASRLQHVSEMILRWLELNGEDVAVIRTADGRPTGLARIVSMADDISVSASLVGGSLVSVDEEHTSQAAPSKEK